MPTRFAAAYLLLAALVPCAPAWAEDPTSPAEAYAAKTASLPAPAAADGFRFDGVLRINGKILGHGTLQATPEGGAREAWRVGDLIVIKARAHPTIEFAEARLGRTLDLLEGTVESSKKDSQRITWTRTDTGLRGVTKVTEDDVTKEEVRSFEHAGSAMTTLAGTILFARFALPEKGTYATTIFEVENGMKGKEALHPVTIEVVGEQELDGKRVLLVKGRKGEQTLELLFAPEGKELVGVRFEEGPQRVELLKADRWHQPARDALAAANRAAYAFGTGDVDVLDDVILWPVLYEEALKTRPKDAKGEPPDVDTWRQKMVATWRERLPKRPPEMIAQGLEMVTPEIKQVQLAEDVVEVTYPETFRNLRMIVRKAYGFWHLAALPSSAPAPNGAPKDAPPAPKDAPQDEGDGK